MLPIIDSESIDQLKEGKAYVGTGPFVFDSWTPSSKIEFSRNDDYWGEKPHLDGVEIDIVSDPQAAGLPAALRPARPDHRRHQPRPASRWARTASSTSPPSRARRTRSTSAPTSTNPSLAGPQGAPGDRLRASTGSASSTTSTAASATPGNLPWAELLPGVRRGGQPDLRARRGQGQGAWSPGGEVAAHASRCPTRPATPTTRRSRRSCRPTSRRSASRPSCSRTEYSEFIKQLIGGTFGGLWILQHAYAQYTPSTLTVSAYPFNADKNASHFESPTYKKHADGGVGAGQRHRRRRRRRPTRRSTRTCSTTCS